MNDTERNELIADLNYQILENGKLKAKIRQQERIIQQLRGLLADLGIEAVTEKEIQGYTEPQKGRPKQIDTETRQRIRILKQNGLSVREIAKQEGVSIGSVSNVINTKEQ